MKTYKLAILGGGITGLAAAHAALSKKKTLPNELCLLESSPRVGGTLQTIRRDGFLLEVGPDSFLTDKPEALELCRELGLSSEVIKVDPRFRRSFIAQGGTFTPMQERFGPLLTDLGLSQSQDHAVGGPRYEFFASLKRGLGSLAEALEKRLGDVVRKTWPVQTVLRRGPHWEISSGQDKILAEKLLLGVPAHAAARLLKDQDPEMSGVLDSLVYSSLIAVHFAYADRDLASSVPGAGFVIPASEGKTALACTVSSQKWEGRAPEGGLLLRVFCGGTTNPEALEWDDSSLVERLSEDVRDLLKIHAVPLFAHVARHKNALPKTGAGHAEFLERLNRRLMAHSTLALAGNAYQGPGLSDCIASARSAAARLLQE